MSSFVNFNFNKASVISYSKMHDLSLLEQVVYVARVSNSSNQINHETSENLLNINSYDISI